MPAQQIPVNANATAEARQLLEQLKAVSGKAILTGQHTQTNPMEERTYIKEVTGHYPKIVGFELLSYSPNINYKHASGECLTEVCENQNTMETALKLARESDVILTFCFHWFSPIGGSDKSFYTEHTDFDPTQVLIEGTPERKAFFSDLEVIAGQLGIFYEEKIPVLWRPFHEVEGTWFWWGSKGGKVAAELYKLMYHFFVDEKKLDNLLWVWSSPTSESYPGDEYVDVIGWDIYLPEKTATDYKEQYETLVRQTTKNKVAAITEVGYNPDIKLLCKNHVPWAYYMTWSKEFILGEQYNTKEELREMYDSDYAIKL